ncbi:sigma-54 interaction domain-containing protein [Lutispora saccharofermentans]|uniref:Sigma 54-interacting transcriptional regulator n=1 Tax=Lutispora saccharofermentans TaxID=3024236 RepID=A0ABT1NDC5_9FIRM|nr:sigma 54-interacting transcriptional regulator [Lutispora saccharofermentans]MCQ1529252.1 sigma 54-interacting transcriptional regulator [Lutispora saccharofermentans]
MKELERIIRDKEFIFESLHDGISIIDHRGIVVYVNNSNTRITKKEKSYFLGKYVQDIVPDSGMLGVLETGQKLIDITTHVFDANVISNIVPIMDGGRIIGVISIFRDITEIKQLTDKLEYANTTIKQLYGKLHKVNEDMSDFVAGKSQAMKEALKYALKAGMVDSNLLIEGESGTGKEVLARFVHKNSPRKDKPFLAVNCASIPFNLLESELFGYEEGAFTGAKKGGHPGYFEMASGGTLLLDEIADMDIALQSKILRVIQNKEIMKVGGSRLIPIDVRIVAATHKDLRTLVASGKFRGDLFYRLEVIRISLPPLRERKEDIIYYIDNMLGKMREKTGRKVSLGEDALKILNSYDYPGNIRELENIIERAVVMDEDGIITKKDLPLYIAEHDIKSSSQLNLQYNDHFPTIKEIEADAIKKAMEKYKNKSKVADVLNISRASLYRKMEKYNIN